jgi:molybdate transport system substrate-binding protein
MRQFALIACFILWQCTAAAETVTVFAAASLKTALDQVASDWQKSEGVVISYGGSAAMAKQIIAGAPADIFISAAPEWMDQLQTGGQITNASRRNLWGNQLVLIGPANAAPIDLSQTADFFERLGPGRLAMGAAASVPAGHYGRAALTYLGLWPQAQDHLAETENVRAALELVARGQTPLGVVYASDAQGDARVAVVAQFPENSHPPILYPAALTATANGAAVQFLDYLASPAASARFAAQGFTILATPND